MAFLLDALKVQRGSQAWLTHVDGYEASHYLTTLMDEHCLQQMIVRCRDCHALLTQTPQVNTELVISDLLVAWETLLDN